MRRRAFTARAMPAQRTASHGAPSAVVIAMPRHASAQRRADARGRSPTIDDIGIPSLVLMENAGRQVVAAMEAASSDLLDQPRRGAVRPRQQRRRRLRRRAHAAPARRRRLGVPGRPRRRRQRRRAHEPRDSRPPRRRPSSRSATSRRGSCTPPTSSDCTLIVDALFGTGLTRPLTGLFETIVPTSTRRRIPVVAIDLPSGLSADRRTSSARPSSGPDRDVRAPKLPLVLPPAEALCGDS